MRDHRVWRFSLSTSLVLLTVMAAGRAVAAPLAEGLAELPAAGQGAISGALGRDNAAYHALPSGGGYRLVNSAQGLAVEATDAGVMVEAGNSRWSLRLTGWGYGSNLQPLERAAPSAEDNRVEYRHGAATEWYVNGPLGLQQGFTLEAAPTSNRIGLGEALTLELNQTGDLDLTVDEDLHGVTLARAGGPAVLRYRGLTAYDATGRELPAWAELQGTSLLLRVDDTGAVYPVVVDPFVEQAKLTASDGATGDHFGFSVAITWDAVVVGAPLNDNPGNEGAAYVFVKPPGGWKTPMTTPTFSAKLTASDGLAGDEFGSSVAMTWDTVVVGAHNHNSGALRSGAAYVFVKPVGGWSTAPNPMPHTAKLTASSKVVGDELGVSVAMDSDFSYDEGRAVVVGAPAPFSSGRNGSVYVFVRPDGGWAGTRTETAILTAPDGAANDQLGSSVAVGEAGRVVLAGAPAVGVAFPGPNGSAYVFEQPPSGWGTGSPGTVKLTAPDGAASDQFGASVALSHLTAVVGAPLDNIGANTDQGSAHVFVRPSAGWGTGSPVTVKLTASGGEALDRFGSSVAAWYRTVVVGAPFDGAGGSAYVFVQPTGESGWGTASPVTTRLTASDGAASDSFGASVGVHWDAVVVGAYFHDIGAAAEQGSAYVNDFVPVIEAAGDNATIEGTVSPGTADDQQFEVSAGVRDRAGTGFLIDLSARKKPGIGQTECPVTLTVISPNNVVTIDHETLEIDFLHFQLQSPETGLWTTRVEASAQCTEPQDYEILLQETTIMSLRLVPQLLILGGLLGAWAFTWRRRQPIAGTRPGAA